MNTFNFWGAVEFFEDAMCDGRCLFLNARNGTNSSLEKSTSSSPIDFQGDIRECFLGSILMENFPRVAKKKKLGFFPWVKMG